MAGRLAKLILAKHLSSGNASASHPVVLMYHGTPSGNPSSIYSINAGRFLEHLEYLKNGGWNTILFSDLLSGVTFPPKTVALTFDDGYADNFNGAFIPILERNMKATWFIASDYVGGYATWMGKAVHETKMLDQSQLCHMSSQGMEIGSHSCSHPDLSSLDYDKQLEEITTSKAKLEAILLQEVLSFAYPFGKYNSDSVEAVKSSGFRIACSTSSGSVQTDSNLLLVPRITIFADDSVSDLACKLTFAANEVPLSTILSYYLSRVRSRLGVY